MSKARNLAESHARQERKKKSNNNNNYSQSGLQFEQELNGE
tara:strand:+ start:768 stop:890 length:123 start_codon:yes stop_codon:yes gene_type:complete